MQRSGRAWIPVLALLLVVPGVQATLEGVMDARSIHHTGETWMRGDVAGIWFNEESRMQDMRLTIEAEGMVATQRNESSYQGPTAGNIATAAPGSVEPTIRTVQTGPVRLSTAWQHEYSKLLIFGAERGSSIPVQADALSPVSVPTEFINYGPNGFSTEGDRRQSSESTYFPSGSIDGPFIFTTATEVPLEVELAGDLHMNLHGIDLDFVSDTEAGRLYSGNTQEPLQPGFPSDVRKVHRTYLEIELIGARLVLSSESSYGSHAQLVLRHADAVSRDGTVLRDAVPAELSGQPRDVRLGPADVLHAIPQGDVVRVSPSEPGAVADAMAAGLLPQTTIVDPTRGPGTGGILAVLAVSVALAGAAIGAYILRIRTARKVDMPHVEAALEAGQYREAARLARRVMQRDPFRDGAAIALAVAYTRDGRPQMAVRSAQRHLRFKDPGDGVLHYVMGMALLELGRRREAQQAMEEAVERTPALSEEVAERLGLPPTREPPMDGVAYV